MRERIVGRDRELSAIDGLLEAGTTRAGLLVLEGEAGIGKTLLREAATETARQRGSRVLLARPAEAEAALPYAGLHDLLATVTNAELDTLPPPQRQALDVALYRAAPGDTSPDAAAVSIAALGVLRSLAAIRPLFVAVDDIQWLDPSTAAVLRFAWRRLSTDRVASVMVRRAAAGPGRDDGTPEVAPGAWHERLVVGPLSVGALHQVLRAELGHSLARPDLVRLHELTAGNPFFAVELVRAHGPAAASRVAPGVALPEALEQVVGGRIRALEPETRRVVEVVSLMGRPATGVVADVMGDVADVARHLRDAERARLLVLEASRVTLAHPLLGAVIRAAMGPAAARLLHERIAAVVTDPFQRARHLALSAEGPEEAVAGALDAAADAAAARGASVEVSELRELAVSLTDRDDPAALARRRVALADASFTAGDTTRARQELESLLPGIADRAQRVEAQLLLATILWYEDETEAGAEIAQRALGDAADDPSARAKIHARLAWLRDDLDGQLLHATAALELLDPESEPATYAFALLNHTYVRFISGHGADDEAIQRGSRLQDAAVSWEFSTIPANWAKAMDRFDEASKLLQHYLVRARQNGDESSVAQLLAYETEIECWTGDLHRAAELAEEALAAAEQADQPVFVALSLARRALVRLYEGDLARARDDADRSLSLAQPPLLPPAPLAILGLISLIEGDPKSADRAFTEAAAMLDGIGMHEPAPYRFQADHVEAVIQLGDLERAEVLNERLEERARIVPRPWIRAIAARSRGLLAAARGDLLSALAAFEAALAAHQALPMPLELGRTLLAQGIVLRRSGRRRLARESIESALGRFAHVGRAPWVARAETELARLGVTRGDEDQLTPSEDRIARMAAAGLTNRTIADRLSISPKTVEANLARTYAKLGIHSRAELGAWMAGGPGEGGRDTR